MSAELPADVLAVIRAFRTAELATLAKDGTPICWPVVPYYDEATGRFIVTTSIALDQKMKNARRDPHVSLLFSDPTASGLDGSDAVLVQGLADAPDTMTTSLDGFESLIEQVFRRQPQSALYTRTRFSRWLFDWYYMRLTMTVTPTRWFRVPSARAGSLPRPLEVDDARA